MLHRSRVHVLPLSRSRALYQTVSASRALQSKCQPHVFCHAPIPPTRPKLPLARVLDLKISLAPTAVHLYCWPRQLPLCAGASLYRCMPAKLNAAMHVAASQLRTCIKNKNKNKIPQTPLFLCCSSLCRCAGAWAVFRPGAGGTAPSCKGPFSPHRGYTTAAAVASAAKTTSIGQGGTSCRTGCSASSSR